jgi:hypothetical protein
MIYLYLSDVWDIMPTSHKMIVVLTDIAMFAIILATVVAAVLK